MVSRALSGSMVPSQEYANNAGKTISPEVFYEVLGGGILVFGALITIADQMHVSEQRSIYATMIADIDSGVQPNPVFH